MRSPNRAAAAIGSLLVFQDADGAIETVKDLVPGRRLVSIVVLNRAGLPAAVWQAPSAGETQRRRARAVSYDGNRVGTLVLGLSLALRARGGRPGAAGQSRGGPRASRRSASAPRRSPCSLRCGGA